MLPMRLIVRAIIVFILAAACCAGVMAADSPDWVYSYRDALKLAASRGKPILANFYTNWCGWCKKLDETTYTDSAVLAAAGNYVCLKVDVEQNRDVAAGYGVRTLPTILFLDPTGRVIWREFGYRDAPFMAKRMREVLGVYEKAAAVEPYIRKAFDEARSGNIDDAIDILNSAAAKYPDDARLFAARSSLYMLNKDAGAALADLDRSVALNPTDDTVLTMRGMIRYQQRDLEKALDDFNAAIAINRWAYEAYNGRGVIYLETENPGLAVKNFNATTLINPKHPSAYFHRGVAHMQMGELEKAIEDLTKAVELKPDLMNAYSNRAAAYLYTGQYDKSWDDVHFVERHGFSMKPEFMADLRQRSGRER